MIKRVRRNASEQYIDVRRQKLIVFAALGVLVGILLFRGCFRIVQASWHHASEVVGKSQTYTELAEENRRLASETDFLATPEGTEFAVRSDLGYIAEGEQPLDVVVGRVAQSEEKFGARLRMSLDDIRTNTLVWACETKDIVCCMLGIWEPVMPELNDRVCDEKQNSG